MNNHPQKEQQSTTMAEYLTFTLGDEQYGIDILKVKEIRGYEPMRELHDAPGYVAGVLDFRGRIIPVLDLRIRFGIEDYEYKPTTVIIVLAAQDDEDMMGVVVDSVSDVLSVRQDEIKQSPSLGAKIKTDYIIGMVSDEKSMIMLVDSDRLIDKNDLDVEQA